MLMRKWPEHSSYSVHTPAMTLIYAICVPVSRRGIKPVAEAVWSARDI